MASNKTRDLGDHFVLLSLSRSKNTALLFTCLRIMREIMTLTYHVIFVFKTSFTITLPYRTRMNDFRVDSRLTLRGGRVDVCVVRKWWCEVCSVFHVHCPALSSSSRTDNSLRFACLPFCFFFPLSVQFSAAQDRADYLTAPIAKRVRLDDVVAREISISGA